MKGLAAAASVLCLPVVLFAAPSASEDWEFVSPRDEIRPRSSYDASGGYQGAAQWIISADDRPGLAGYWTRRFPVQGGMHYRLIVFRAVDGIDLPRRAAIARLVWLDDDGRPVLRREPVDTSYRPGERPRAEPEFPKPVSTDNDWTKLQGVYEAPPDASSVKVELHFRWGPPGSTVRWSMPQFDQVPAPPPRIVRLASVHYQPHKGQTREEKCAQFAPFIAEAAERDVDLVVLPETLTYYGTRGTYADAAEPVPGPSTEYFARLAKQHDLYIVAGLIERDGHLLYNVAVLLSPDGELVGKYRKVTLPRGEIEGGLTPGHDVPVFETRFGKVGMMICYDGFFPEVARELANRGAEVIAWPVWGCNPLLASARACENHLYVVSSTYTEYSRNWILSAIYGHDGQTLAHAESFGTLAVAEVDLNQPTYWHSLGDFQAQIQPHRPDVTPSK
jgi:predicted amidohydrolase